MKDKRKAILSIAGFDPSGGAGVLADCKTFEQHRLLGRAVCTAMTLQNTEVVNNVSWRPINEVKKEVKLLLAYEDIKFAKIGIVPHFQYLLELVNYLHQLSPDIKIIWDPIIKASSGTTFIDSVDLEMLPQLLRKLYILTPNWDEFQILFPDALPVIHHQKIAQYCKVYLKGGHREQKLGIDELIEEKGVRRFMPKQKDYAEKHGSGCVLSAAILSNIALGYPDIKAHLRAKRYVERYLSSHHSKDGYHEF